MKAMEAINGCGWQASLYSIIAAQIDREEDNKSLTNEELISPKGYVIMFDGSFDYWIEN
jgi:hypothetical protein